MVRRDPDEVITHRTSSSACNCAQLLHEQSTFMIHDKHARSSAISQKAIHRLQVPVDDRSVCSYGFFHGWTDILCRTDTSYSKCHVGLLDLSGCQSGCKALWPAHSCITQGVYLFSQQNTQASITKITGNVKYPPVQKGFQAVVSDIPCAVYNAQLL